MPENPYSPPASHEPDALAAPRPLRGAPHYILLLVFFGYCLAVERWVHDYSITDLISTGTIPALPIFCFLLGSASLMAGIGQNMFRPWLGKTAMLIGAAVLAFAIAATRGEPAFAMASRMLFGLGMATSLLGLWVVHHVRAIIVADYSKEAAEDPPCSPTPEVDDPP